MVRVLLKKHHLTVYFGDPESSRYIWGTGEFGQTGMRPEGTALRPKDLWTPTKLPFKFSVSKIACGYEHCLAVPRPKHGSLGTDSRSITI